MQEWLLFYPVRPWTINKDRNWHPKERAKHIKQWREAFYLLAKEASIPRQRYITVDIQPVLADNRLQDTAACVTAAKAAIDGIVDADVIEDDNPTYLGWIRFFPPVVERGTNGLLVKIYAEERLA